MFGVCQNDSISIETRLISNRHSTNNVINYIIQLDNPSKLRLKSADKMLHKMRKLVAENPVELLIHHTVIFDRIFMVLSADYQDLENKQNLNIDNSNASVIGNQQAEDEDRQDVVFECFLLMIDLFYSTFPDYKQLLSKYIEEHFYQPKVFVALTA